MVTALDANEVEDRLLRLCPGINRNTSKMTRSMVWQRHRKQEVSNNVGISASVPALDHWTTTIKRGGGDLIGWFLFLASLLVFWVGDDGTDGWDKERGREREVETVHAIGMPREGVAQRNRRKDVCSRWFGWHWADNKKKNREQTQKSRLKSKSTQTSK